MAKIVENTHGGRRMIRLSTEDMLMVITRVQQEFRGGPASYTDLKRVLSDRPFYLPEEAV